MHSWDCISSCVKTKPSLSPKCGNLHLKVEVEPRVHREIIRSLGLHISEIVGISPKRNAADYWIGSGGIIDVAVSMFFMGPYPV